MKEGEMDLEKLKTTIANRGECAGPLTTFNHGDSKTLTHVSIACRDNWAEVIQWLAAMERDVPELIAECERLRSVYEAAVKCVADYRSGEDGVDEVEAVSALAVAIDRARGAK